MREKVSNQGKFFENYQKELSLALQQKCDWTLFRDKTFLISGATGLIGTVLVDMLRFLHKSLTLNIKLILISRNITESDYGDDFIKIIPHDINFPITEKLGKLRIDYIIHAASNTHPELYASKPIETITTNVMGTYNLLQCAAENPGCRFLLTSSVEVYGNDEKKLAEGFSEKDFGYLDSNILRAGYPESKRLSESLCQAFKSEKNVYVIIARLARCYGLTLRSDDTKVLSQFLQNAKSRNDIVLKSDGKQCYSYLYSMDAASAILFLLLKGENGEAYNVSGVDSKIRLYELASLLADMTGTKVIRSSPNELEKKGFSKAENAVLNTKKINQLGWKSKTGLKEGLMKILDVKK